MRINEERLGLEAVLEKLNASTESSIETHTQAVVLKLLDNRDLPSKVSDLRKKINRLSISECLVTIEKGKIVLKDTAGFEDGLASWVANEGGRAAEAADSIRRAFYLEETVLDFQDFKLKTLPLELGNCTNLQKLHLCNNQLQHIPQEIGKCISLTHLHLSNNRLKNLPQEIGNCINLQHLFLHSNQIQHLPQEIGKCTNLQILDLGFNQLQNLPPELGNCINIECLPLRYNCLQNLPKEIGKCTNLQHLDLKYNQLQDLPLELGNCIKISEFNIKHNPSLRSLPLSLGNCSNLTHFSTEKTAIPDTQRETILSIAAAKRANQSQNELLRKLALWKGFAGSDLDLDSILKNLKGQQKAIIYEWLVRLERSQDFVTNQQNLAKLVCQMLFSLSEGEDYRASFLDHVQANNVQCGDRAAMSLNILYTFWKTEKVLTDKPLKEKLELALKIARTNALRENLKEQIDAREIAQGHKEDERVEIELYYETYLKEELGLETAVSGMLYGDIGRRDWINGDQLRGHVQDRAYAFLADMEPIKGLARKDQSVQDKLTAKQEKYHSDRGANEPEGEYISRLERERDQYNRFEQETIISWAKEILES